MKKKCSMKMNEWRGGGGAYDDVAVYLHHKQIYVMNVRVYVYGECKVYIQIHA